MSLNEFVGIKSVKNELSVKFKSSEDRKRTKNKSSEQSEEFLTTTLVSTVLTWNIRTRATSKPTPERIE